MAGADARFLRRLAGDLDRRVAVLEGDAVVDVPLPAMAAGRPGGGLEVVAFLPIAEARDDGAT